MKRWDPLATSQYTDRQTALEQSHLLSHTAKEYSDAAEGSPPTFRVRDLLHHIAFKKQDCRTGPLAGATEDVKVWDGMGVGGWIAGYL